MLLEVKCGFRRSVVTVLHCQYRGKYLINCVLNVLSRCECFKLYFLKFLDDNVPTCNEVKTPVAVSELVTFSATKCKW